MRGWERMDRWDLEGWKLWTLGPLFGDMDFMFQVMLYGFDPMVNHHVWGLFLHFSNHQTSKSKKGRKDQSKLE